VNLGSLVISSPTEAKPGGGPLDLALRPAKIAGVHEGHDVGLGLST